MVQGWLWTGDSARHLLANQSPLVALQKFVSTTVRPTLLPYTELYHWDGCASFVSDYLTMEPLESPITPVRKGLQSHQKQPHDRGERRASQQDAMWKPWCLGFQRSLTSLLRQPPDFPRTLCALFGSVMPVQCSVVPVKQLSTISTRLRLTLLSVTPDDQLVCCGLQWHTSFPSKDQEALEQRSI